MAGGGRVRMPMLWLNRMLELIAEPSIPGPLLGACGDGAVGDGHSLLAGAGVSG